MRFIWPLPRIISRDFYYLGSKYIGGQHGAIDIPASSGTPIKAVVELNRTGTAVVIATHDLDLMEQVSARRLVLSEGRLEIYD
ncbi:hypothetical protein LCGC14_0188570 [marine sediment metagenome]|uniref:Cell division ATP-binding protein FtsE n=1 Tax=marine sediment metagenome TaxID=412755 RepID=A0A0F9XQA0_9ZZZZ